MICLTNIQSIFFNNQEVTCILTNEIYFLNLFHKYKLLKNILLTFKEIRKYYLPYEYIHSPPTDNLIIYHEPVKNNLYPIISPISNILVFISFRIIYKMEIMFYFCKI